MSMIDIILGLFLSWLVSRTTGLPMFPWSIGAVAAIYFLTHKSGSGAGSVVSAVTTAVGRTVEFFERLVMGTVIFIVIFMIMNRITGVPPEYATEGFRLLGVRPWGWPAHVGLPLLVFAITTLYACHLAVNAVHGKKRMVTLLFGGVVIAYLMPETAGKAIPKNIDHATAQDGVAGVGTTAVVTVVGGERAFDEDKGVWGSTKERFNRFWFGKPGPTPPPAVVPPPTQQKSGEALVLERQCQTPCSAQVGWSYKIRTDGDPLDILYNGCSTWVHRPAKGDFQAPKCFKPGEAKFASPEGKDPHIDVWVYRKVS